MVGREACQVEQGSDRQLAVEAMTIFGVSEANSAANSLWQGCPSGGSWTVTWPGVFGDSSCLLTVVQVDVVTSWSPIVVGVLMMRIVHWHMSLVTVALVSFLCPTFAEVGVDGYTGFVCEDEGPQIVC